MVWFNHGIKSYYEFIAYQESRWALAILASAIHVQCTFRAQGCNGAAETRTQSSTESSSESDGLGPWGPAISESTSDPDIPGWRCCTVYAAADFVHWALHLASIKKFTDLTFQWFGTLEKGQPLSFTTKIYQCVTIEIAHYAGMGCACSCTEGLNWLLVC